ncbi:uncharacterized protein LOC127738532 [Mytilus californianus]|uniref:uncharacterized protein LOC127738532 n=1 Tax=Mytilus californianus TaxID=6549 RepID=UPI0022474A58|nr:uncharacterized protein LOC127738532 [Mytilus californianus]
MSFDDEKIERPAWTLFFEGTLYRRYLRYLKHHDLSQMLNNGTTLPFNYKTPIQPPILTHETSWYSPPKFQSEEDEMPPPYHPRSVSASSDRSQQDTDYKKIRNRTRVLVCLGITLIALTAAIVALVIHYFYIETQKEVIESGQNFIHIPGNFTANETLAILQDNNTRIIKEKYITDLRDAENELKFTSPAKPVGKGSFWRNDDPTSTTTTKKPKLVLISRTTTEETEEWYPSSSSPPTFEPVLISDVETAIGKKKATFSCTIQTNTGASVYLKGKNIKLNFTKSQKIIATGIQQRQTYDYGFKIMDDSNMTKITLKVLIQDVQCEDQEDFVCGYKDKLTTTEKHGKLTVQRKPSSSIKMKSPVGIIEGQVVEIEATWKGGYPTPIGNITWFYSEAGGNLSDAQAFTAADISWRMKIREDSCKTYINSIVKFKPTLEMNNTMLYAVSSFSGVQAGTERILVIPENYCDDKTGNAYKPHPYTCKKFVRCRTDRIDVYECPKNTCFTEDVSHCV